MAIHKVGESYVIASQGFGWLPGAYDTERTAKYAFRFPVSVLQKLQEEINHIDNLNRLITYEDLKLTKAQMMEKND